MDETQTVTRQLIDDGRGTLLRVGEREYFRPEGDTTDRRWFAQPSGKPVEAETAALLDALYHGGSVELSPEEPKPLDVDDVYDDLVAALVASDEALEQELGRQPTPADKDLLCASELAGQLYGRDDSVAVAAVTEALGRPYLNYGTVASVFRGEQECC